MKPKRLPLFTAGIVLLFALAFVGVASAGDCCGDCCPPPCCECGCTYTMGYWKTHSEYGPAPYDNTWANLPDGADTLFYNSGKTWYQVFWTPPRGDAYYILAHQYMAAYLNHLNGAYVPGEVTATWMAAKGYFMGYTNPDRKTLIGWAETLTQYNEGIIGPGHCDS